MSKSSIEVRNRAEDELLKYKKSDYFWCKHIIGETLRSHQELYCSEMDSHDDMLLIGSRRINKSWTLAFKFLKWVTTDFPGIKANCFAPALEQSRRNLKYMTDMILKSQVLYAYIDRRLGRKGIGSDYINFLNGGEIRAKGQASSTDGLGSHIIWADEFDDMDIEVFNERILGTGAENVKDVGLNATKVIRSGTIKGKGNIYKCEHDQEMRQVIYTLPKIDCYVGIELGIISQDYIDRMRKVLTRAQFKRMFLCEYTESNNFYKTSDLNRCSTSAIAPIQIIHSKKFERKSTVRVGLGFDAAGKSALATRDNDGKVSNKRVTRANYACTVIAEIKPGLYQWLYSKEWDKATKSTQVENELFEIWNFFKPEKGMGDAYNSDLILRVNKKLFQKGLIKTNPDKFQDGPGINGWDGLTFVPFRFDGVTQHTMHLAMQKLVEDMQIFFPKYILDHPNYKDLQTLIFQFENVRSKPTSFDYDSYYCENNMLGDDIVDSCLAAWYSLQGNTATELILPSGQSFGKNNYEAIHFKKPSIISPKIVSLKRY